jgi:hypothetical protein
MGSRLDQGLGSTLLKEILLEANAFWLFAVGSCTIDGLFGDRESALVPYVLDSFGGKQSDRHMQNNYQVLLYNGLGLYGSMPLLLYALWDTWAALMNLVNALLLDKLGRIPIMVVGQVRRAAHLQIQN